MTCWSNSWSNSSTGTNNIFYFLSINPNQAIGVTLTYGTILHYYHDDPFFALFFFTINFTLQNNEICRNYMYVWYFTLLETFKTQIKMNYRKANNKGNTQILWCNKNSRSLLELQILVLTILLCLPWAFLCSSRSLLTVSSSVGSPCSSLSLISSSLLLSASFLSSGPRIWSNTRKQFHWTFINTFINTNT